MMLSSSRLPSLHLQHDAWIRRHIRDLVLHQSAPAQTAELMQVALITLTQCAAQFDWSQPGGHASFVGLARDRVKAELADEVLQMTRLTRLQRRRWCLVKLAREHVMLRLRIHGEAREATLEELAVATGLSVNEIEVLDRMARLCPWEASIGSHPLMGRRAWEADLDPRPHGAREGTALVFERLAPLLLKGQTERIRVLERSFGVTASLTGQAVQRKPARPPGASFRRLGRRLFPKAMERRAFPKDAPALTTHFQDEWWTPRLEGLLQPPGAPTPAAAAQAGLPEPPYRLRRY